MSVIHHGVQGLNLAQSNLLKAGNEIANANNNVSTKPIQSEKIAETNKLLSFDEADLSSPLIDLQISKLQAQASSKVIATGNDVLGSLLDIKV